MNTQGGKSLITTVILIDIDFPSSWEFFISMGDTYFHRIRNDNNPKKKKKKNEAKIKLFFFF